MFPLESLFEGAIFDELLLITDPAKRDVVSPNNRPRTPNGDCNANVGRTRWTGNRLLHIGPPRLIPGQGDVLPSGGIPRECSEIVCEVRVRRQEPPGQDELLARFRRSPTRVHPCAAGSENLQGAR